MQKPSNSLSAIVLERDVLDAKRLLKLLQEGLNPSEICQFGYYPLEIAALRRNVEIVTMLLDAGAVPDITHERGRPSNVLSYATKTNANSAVMAEICRKLVEAGANPNGNDPEHESPLHAATKSGNVEAVKILAELGADLEQVAMSRVFSGEVLGSPLRRARMALSEPMMLVLLRLGADDACLAEGELTAFQSCVQMGFGAVIEYYVKERGEDLSQKSLSGKPLLELTRKEPAKRLLKELMAQSEIDIAVKDTASKLKVTKPIFDI